MKKIISLILTVAMLLSMTTFVAPVSAEQTREEILNTPPTEYIELNLFHDAFATYAERKSTDWYAWASGNITTIWPYKGVFSGENASYPRSRANNDTPAASDYAFMIDLGAGKSTYSNGVDIKTNPNVSYDETLERYIVNANGIKYKLGKIEEGKFNGNYAGIGIKYNVTDYTIADGLGIKEQTFNTNVYPNIGTAKESQKAVYSINKSGITEINLLMTNMRISLKTLTLAAYVPGTIEYTDGTKVEIGLVVGNGASSFQNSIYAVPKSAGYTTVDQIETNGVAGNTVAGKDIVNSNVTLPQLSTRTSYIPEYSMQLATIMRNYKGGEFDGYVHSYSIPVDETKTVKTITLNKNTDISTSFFDPSAATIANGTAGTATCLIPFTVNGVEDDYTYYFMSSRNCSTAGIFAMSVTSETLQSKIDKIEARIEALDSQYNPAQKNEIAEIKNAIEALKNEGVLETDFDDALITKLNGLYDEAEAEIKAAQIASVEGKITNMAFKYVSSMRAEVEGIKAEYDSLINSGILSSEFNQDLLTKFTKVYDVYVMSAGLEDKAEGWGNEYLYTMYNDVKGAKELADGLEKNENAGTGVIDAVTSEKINKFDALATAGAAIDAKIDGLDIVYNNAQLEKIVEIKADIDTFYGNGGTDKGLANAEIFNAIYAAADTDLLQRDIDNVVAKINALPELYTATADNDIAKIHAEITAIEEKGGVIPSDAASKLASLIAQRDEAPAYEIFNLPYNKDVVESIERYRNQYKDDKGEYVKDANGIFVSQVKNLWSPAAFITGSLTTIEEEFASKLGVDLETNRTTVEKVPYQFGKIKTTVDGKVDAEGNSMSSAVATAITVDVPNNAYSKIHAIMWAHTDKAGVKVTYVYADGSKSEEANITKIAGGEKGNVSQLMTKEPNYYKQLATIGNYRAYNQSSDKTHPTGGYSITATDHILTPDDKKILDKIEFNFATADAHVFAMTGQIANSVLLNKVLADSVEKFENTAEENIRAVLEGCTNIMASLDEKEVAYAPALAAAVTESKNTFVAVESITAYTDLDNMTYTVKFTGPVAPSSVTKELFAVTETIVEGTVTKEVTFTNYEVVPVVDNGEIREVKVVIKNDYNYNRKLKLTVSKDVTGVSGKNILTNTVKEYDAKPAVDAEVTIENAAGTVKLTNNMNAPQEVTAVIAVYNKNNQMVAKYLVNKVLTTGEGVSQAVAFDLQDGQTIECLIVDSLTNCRKIYNSFIFE